MELEPFEDVREIQRKLLAEGLDLVETVDETTTGPGYVSPVDPDGNPVLIDQHV